jgi:hypothetical protein
MIAPALPYSIVADLRTSVIDEATHRSRNLLLSELIGLIERSHPHSEPGLARETLAAYAEALAEEPEFTLDANEFIDTVEDSLLETETWVEADSLYAVGDDHDRISIYPIAWHDRLGGETDVREHITYLEGDESGFADGSPKGGIGTGIDQPTLLDTVSTLGGIERDSVLAQIEARRSEGQLRKPADQHPDARVQLS